MLFTTSCAGCNQPGVTLCRRCRFSLASVPRAGAPAGVRAALPFDGVARQMVLQLKYGNRRSAARHLAALMVHRLRLAANATGPDARVDGRVDVVTWAPTSAHRAGARGFDQAELLARAVARELGVPCRRLLYRSHGPAQTGRSRAERLHGPVFRARQPRRGLRVLVVDDVVTTGATLLAARDALLGAGVADVVCAAATSTPNASASVGPRRLLRAS
jgi:predicted amidophosphoribosyltransferase